MKYALMFCLLAFHYSGKSQTLGFYGGAGISYDGFLPDRSITTGKSGQTFLPSAFAVAGLRYHTLQNFDLTLDASLGITRTELPVTSEYKDTRLQYEQIQSLILLGSGLNIALNNGAHLTPFIQLGAAFYDFWDFVIQQKQTYYSTENTRDFKTNHWTVACGAGIDYQFRLFLSSGVNLRWLYTPVNIFREPIAYELAGQQQSETFQLQGKMTQFQLSYRVQLPIKKWKDATSY